MELALDSWRDGNLPGSLDEAARRAVAIVVKEAGVPAALLRREGTSWHFAAEGWQPDGCRPSRAAIADLATLPMEACVAFDTGGPEPAWTAVLLGEASSAAWILLLPGRSESWRHTAFMSNVAPRVGALLEEVSLRDELARSRAFARALHRFSARLLRVRSPRALHELILRTMARQVRARIGALAVYLPEEGALAITATCGYPLEVVEHVRIPPGEGVLGGVFATGRPALVEQWAAPSRRLRYHTDAYVAVPIRGPGAVLAVAAFTDRVDGQPFDRRDLSALRVLGNPAGLALSTESFRQMADEVRRLASTDPLTGLLNRRYFDGRLYAEMQRARRHGELLALLMVDLDCFKDINDAHGHLRGDQVLRCVADRLRRSVRIFDVCTRYGGDEFAVLMPSSGPEIALAVAERIRDAVRRHCSADDLAVTVSVGIGLSGGSEDDVLALADRALIQAKRAGKDKVRLPSP